MTDYSCRGHQYLHHLQFFVRGQPPQNRQPWTIWKVTPNHQVNKNERKRGFMIQDYNHQPEHLVSPVVKINPLATIEE